MSFIARIAPAARTASAALKPTAPSISIGATRALSSTACLNKGPVDAAKDTLKAADRTISDAAVKGIEVGENATEKLKGSMGAATGEAQAKSGELKGDAAELAGKGKGKAEEAMGQAKNAAGQAKGKTEELMGEAKGKAKETAGRF